MANHSSVRDDESVAVIQSRTLNTCKAPNGSTAPKYQHSVFTLPATQPTVSRALKARTVSFWGGGTCWRANLQGQLLQFFSVWRSVLFCTSENIVRQPYALQCAVTGCLPHWGTWGFTSHRFLLQCAGARIRDVIKTRESETKTRQAETKTKTRQAETKTETKTREAETKTKTKTSKKWSWSVSRPRPGFEICTQCCCINQVRVRNC